MSIRHVRTFMKNELLLFAHVSRIVSRIANDAVLEITTTRSTAFPAKQQFSTLIFTLDERINEKTRSNYQFQTFWLIPSENTWHPKVGWE